MKMLHPILIAIIALSCLDAQAQRQPKPIFPTTPFNKEEVTHMLETGTSTLRGKVSQESNYLINLVELFPVTPYFMEWLEMKKKDKKGKKWIVMSNEAYTYRILTIINKQDLSFEFKGLKPGKYFIHTTISKTNSGSGERQVGTETITGINGLGQAVSVQSRPIMKKENYLYKTEQDLNSFVEITSDGQVVNVTL